MRVFWLSFFDHYDAGRITIGSFKVAFKRYRNRGYRWTPLVLGRVSRIKNDKA